MSDKYKYEFEAIPTINNSTPFQKQYRLSPAEKEEAKYQLLEFIKKGWVRESDSPFGAPILFAAKKGGALRLVVDYRELNKITIKNRLPLPHIQDCLDMLQGSSIFSSIDLQNCYHQIALQESDIKKTAFRTPMGHFECLVLWEGLCNAPSVFQSIMQKILKPVLGKFCALYLDDIVIFFLNVEEHAEHLG